MSIQSRTIKDQRSLSRVTTNLGCQFTFEGLIHDAYIINLSLSGAFLWSPFIPPKGAHVVITLRTPRLKNVLTLESEVVRTETVSKDRTSGFAVRFSHSSLDLIELVKDLFSQTFRNKV